MNATTKLDKPINAYLVQLNDKQKEAVLTVVKTFVEDQDNDIWQDDRFIAELDRRTAEYESGKAKGITLDELELRTRASYKSGVR